MIVSRFIHSDKTVGFCVRKKRVKIHGFDLLKDKPSDDGATCPESGCYLRRETLDLETADFTNRMRDGRERIAEAYTWPARVEQLVGEFRIDGTKTRVLSLIAVDQNGEAYPFERFEFTKSVNYLKKLKEFFGANVQFSITYK